MTLSPYLQRIRSHIGHELLLLPAVAVLVEDADNRLLLVRQADSGLWSLVGGAIEPGESPEQAAVREAREETGLVVQLGSLVGAFGGQDFVMTYPNGDVVAYVSVAYEATVVTGELRPDGHEVVAATWFTRAEVADLEMQPLSAALLVRVGWRPGSSHSLDA